MSPKKVDEKRKSNTSVKGKSNTSLKRKLSASGKPKKTKSKEKKKKKTDKDDGKLDAGIKGKEPKKKKKSKETISVTKSASSKTAQSISPINRTLQLPDTGYEPPSFEGRIDPDEPLPATNHVSWHIERPVALQTAKAGPLAQKPMTMMTVLRDAANRHPNKLAYASMVDGHWVTVTYQAFLELVIRAAQGFLQLGLQRFNGVAILGQNSTEYLVAHFGIIFAGGVSVPLHVNTSDEFSFKLVKAARCRIMVVDSIKDRKQVLEWRKTFPQLKTIIQCGKDKIDASDDLIAWEQFLRVGNNLDPDVLVTRTLQQAPNLCCCVLQTGGCGGYPKNVMLSHDNLVWGANTIGRYMSLSGGNGVVVNFVPLSTILGLTVSVNIAVRFGTTVYLVPVTRNKAMVLRALKDVRPTIFFAPTIFYEYLHRELELKLEQTSFFKRILTSWAMKIGRKGFDDQTRLTNPPSCWAMANRLLFREVRKEMGLDSCHELFAAGGFMIKSDIEFFLSLDMPLLLAYGLTESSGSHACCLLERFRVDSVGVGLDGCKTKIANPDANGVGELHIGGRNLAMGYLDSEEQTMKNFLPDGTFRTGDLARKDAEGFIYVVGKRSDIVTLSGGEKISTIPIAKSVISNLPFVGHAVVVGDGKPHLVLLMTIRADIDPETELPSDRVTQSGISWFRRAGFDVKLVKDVVSKANPKLTEKIQSIIDRINAESPHEAHKIKNWIFLPSDFTTMSDELSPGLKVRRWVVVKKYAAVIDSMYS